MMSNEIQDESDGRLVMWEFVEKKKWNESDDARQDTIVLCWMETIWRELFECTECGRSSTLTQSQLEKNISAVSNPQESFCKELKSHSLIKLPSD